MSAIIHNEYQQGSQQWLDARAGLPTASEFKNLVTPKFKIKTGEAPETYLNHKLAEYWLGGCLPSWKPAQLEQGQILETEGRSWVAVELGIQIDRVGLVTRADGRVACSPDGLIGEDSGVEIKCPEAHTHVGYLRDGVVPEDYLLQVYGSLYVTGRKSWKFVSYRRHFPLLCLTVERDEAIMDTIGEAVDAFLVNFDEALKALEEINGGPSKQRAMAIAARDYTKANNVRFTWENQDDVPH
jgi:hypothetical protein